MEQAGYALVSVLFLIIVISILCAIILKVQLFHRTEATRTADDMKALYASNNGIQAAIATASPLNNPATNFSIRFPDGSSANVALFQWGLFEGVISQGYANQSHATRSALIAGRLTESDGAAFMLGNLQHGLVLAGNSQIVGDVLVGARGVTTGSLRDEVTPTKVSIRGSITRLTSSGPVLADSVLDRYVLMAKALFISSRRPRMGQDFPGGTLDTTGLVDLAGLSDSVLEIFSSGNVSLMDTIMRRGPPLYIVTRGHVDLQPGTCLLGPVAICSTDSISIPSQVKLFNSLLISQKSIELQSGASVTAQLISPVIRCLSNAIASYPSAFVSVSLSDTPGVAQSVDLAGGARISGAIVTHAGKGISLQKVVTVLKPGSVVTGEVYTDGYLTMDGTVDGLVRAFDLYFYESPTTYLGWMRAGLIDRAMLPYGFLVPPGISGNDRFEVLSWL